MKIKIGFFASGNGSSVENILLKIQNKSLLNFSGVVIITNKKIDEAKIYKVAKKFNIKIFYEKNSKKQLNILMKFNVDLVLCLGYLQKIDEIIINHFKENILNIHPSCLPKYGGDGMHGINVHKKVIENNEKITGATIHLVSKNYDEGKIISQIKTKILENENPCELQKRILKLEYKLLEKTLKNLKFK